MQSPNQPKKIVINVNFKIRILLLVAIRDQGPNKNASSCLQMGKKFGL